LLDLNLEAVRFYEGGFTTDETDAKSLFEREGMVSMIARHAFSA